MHLYHQVLHPNLSLQAELLSEKLEKTISKSSVNHMFRAIKEKANAYRKGETPND